MADKIPPHPTIAHLTTRFGTQTRLAEAAGVRQNTISGKARSDNPLTYKQMHRILEVAPNMGVDVDASDFFPDLQGASQDAAA